MDIHGHKIIERSPLQSKKYVAFVISELSWTLLFGLLFVGMFRLIDAMVGGAEVAVDVAHVETVVEVLKDVVKLGMAMTACKLMIEGTYIGGQAWVDQSVRIAAIVRGQAPPPLDEGRTDPALVASEPTRPATRELVHVVVTPPDLGVVPGDVFEPDSSLDSPEPEPDPEPEPEPPPFEPDEASYAQLFDWLVGKDYDVSSLRTQSWDQLVALVKES